MAQKTNKPKKVSFAKWFILFALTGILDIAQFVIDLTGVGVAVSEIAEPFIGVGLLAIFQIMKINVLNKPKRIGSILGAFGLDALTGGLAPLWIIDIWYIYYDVRKEEVAVQAQYEAKLGEQAAEQKFLYSEGRRLPENEIESQTRNTNLRPLVVDGVRSPRK